MAEMTLKAAGMIRRFMSAYETLLTSEMEDLRAAEKLPMEMLPAALRENPSYRMSRFLEAMNTALRSQKIDVEALLDGMRIISAELSISDDKMSYHHRNCNPVRIEGAYRKRREISEWKSLSMKTHNKIDDRISESAESYYLSKDERARFAAMQDDLIDLFNEMSIVTPNPRRPQGPPLSR